MGKDTTKDLKAASRANGSVLQEAWLRACESVDMLSCHCEAKSTLGLLCLSVRFAFVCVERKESLGSTHASLSAAKPFCSFFAVTLTPWHCTGARTLTVPRCGTFCSDMLVVTCPSKSPFLPSSLHLLLNCAGLMIPGLLLLRAPRKAPLRRLAALGPLATKEQARGALEATQEQALGALEPSLGALEPSLGALKPSLGALEPSLGALEPSLGALEPREPSLGALEATLGALGQMSSWRVLCMYTRAIMCESFYRKRLCGRA